MRFPVLVRASNTAVNCGEKTKLKCAGAHVKAQFVRRQPCFRMAIETKCPASRVAAGQVSLIVNPRTSQENFTSVIKPITGGPASSTKGLQSHCSRWPRLILRLRRVSSGMLLENHG